jgi:putative transcriptional regulator
MGGVAAHERADEASDPEFGPGATVEPGMLLVAGPSLLDPNFKRTVVYIIEHRGEGTLGVVLNRPSNVPVHDVLPAWAAHSSAPQSMFIGGPVEGKTALCLAALRPGHNPDVIGGVLGVRGPVALVDLDADPGELGPRLRGLRVFAGYAGWSPGQLAGEIGRGDWIVAPALPDDVLCADAGVLWGRVLRRQGMPLALLATFPPDVSAN